MAENKRNITMDFIRGISAVFVCCGHLRAVMFLDFNTLDSPSLFDKLFYFFTSLGHEAVMVFFVLSGFFVGGSILTKRLKFKFDGYLIARLSRLWTVLIPALVFTFLIDLIIGQYFPSILIGDFHSQLMSGPNSDYSASFLTFLANISFLQTIYSPVFGSNGPLWSLTNEFWYYITFPLIMFAAGGVKMSLKKRLISTILMLAVGYFFTIHLAGGFLIWLCGVLVFLVYSKKVMNFGYWFTILTFILFVLSLVNSKVQHAESVIPHTDFVVGVCFSLFLISLRNIEKLEWTKRYLAKFSYWISDISYTLYVTHFPVLILVYGVFYKNEQMVLNGSSILQYAGWLTFVILLSRGFWLLFERNTHVVRGAMFKIRNRLANQPKRS